MLHCRGSRLHPAGGQRIAWGRAPPEVRARSRKLPAPQPGRRPRDVSTALRWADSSQCTLKHRSVQRKQATWSGVYEFVQRQATPTVSNWAVMSPSSFAQVAPSDLSHRPDSQDLLPVPSLPLLRIADRRHEAQHLESHHGDAEAGRDRRRQEAVSSSQARRFFYV